MGMHVPSPPSDEDARARIGGMQIHTLLAFAAVASVAILSPGPATLLDGQGRLVRTWAAPAEAAALLVTGVAPGLYLLRVPTAQGLAQQRVVIE